MLVQAAMAAGSLPCSYIAASCVLVFASSLLLPLDSALHFTTPRCRLRC